MKKSTIPRMSVQNAAVQTEDPDAASRHNANVYEKVENTKRCELIRMVRFTFSNVRRVLLKFSCSKTARL